MSLPVHITQRCPALGCKMYVETLLSPGDIVPEARMCVVHAQHKHHSFLSAALEAFQRIEDFAGQPSNGVTPEAYETITDITRRFTRGELLWR